MCLSFVGDHGKDLRVDRAASATLFHAHISGFGRSGNSQPWAEIRKSPEFRAFC